VFPLVAKFRVRNVLFPLVAKFRVRMAVFPPVLAVVVAVAFALDDFTRVVVEPDWSCLGPANASDPVNNAAVTMLVSIRFVFISLCFGSKN
jgi:hypothetical protein